MTASGKHPLLLCVCLSQLALTASRARRDCADPLGPRWGSEGRGRAVGDIPGLLVQCSFCSPCCLGHAYPEVWLSRETLCSDVLLLLPQQHSQPCTGRKVGSRCCAIPALLLSSPASSLTVWLLPSFLTQLLHHRLLAPSATARVKVIAPNCLCPSWITGCYSHRFIHASHISGGFFQGRGTWWASVANL